MLNKLVGLGLLIGLLGSPAFAAPATTQKVTQSVTIAATADKVWGIVQNFGDLGWVPVVKGTTATDGNAPGSVRTLDLGGPKLIEKLEKYDAAGTRYVYDITDDPANVKVLPVTGYRSSITVRASKRDPKSTIVTWTGSFKRGDLADPPAAGLDDATAVKAVTGVYQAGLGNLKKLAEGQPPQQ